MYDGHDAVSSNLRFCRRHMVNLMKLLTKAELPKAIESIQKRGKVLDNDIHVAACSCIAIKGEQGDTMFINRLYLALSAGTRKQALTSWLLTYGGVIANDGSTATAKTEQPFLHTKDKPVRLEEGKADPWYDHKPDPAPDQVFDVMALVQAVLKKAKTAQGKGTEMKHAELLAPLAAMVEAGALSSSMASAVSPSSPSQGEESDSETQSLLPTHGTDGLPRVDLAKGLIGGEPAAMSH
jgi:hypothetical protein